MARKRTKKGECLTELVHEIMHLSGILREHGEQITEVFEQTPARWQVLGAVRDGKRSVSQISRRMGLARQSVQRIAHVLVEQGLAHYEDNPDHVRSPLVSLTEQGQKIIQDITELQKKWSNLLGEGLHLAELQATLAGLRAVRRQMDQTEFPPSFFLEG